MPSNQTRKTSVPIHFHFAHSKRVVPALKDASRAVSSPLRSKMRPPSTLVPRDTPAHRKLPAAVQPNWTPVEISNFPPQLRQSDFIDLLQGYNISPEFDFPVTPRFSRPFRAMILAASAEEAKKMVKDLDRKSVGGRTIAVRMIKDMTEKERQKFHIQDMAEQIKAGIINTVRVYHSDLAEAILEVREFVQDGGYHAFLQKRASTAIHGTATAYALEDQVSAQWTCVAGFTCELDTEMEDSTTIPRLEALKGLQGSLENQGVLEKVWSKWNGSQVFAPDTI